MLLLLRKDADMGSLYNTNTDTHTHTHTQIYIYTVFYILMKDSNFGIISNKSLGMGGLNAGNSQFKKFLGKKVRNKKSKKSKCLDEYSNKKISSRIKIPQNIQVTLSP